MPATLEFEKQLLINNEWRPSSSGKTMEVVNPATEEVIAWPRRARLSAARGGRCRRASAAASSAGWPIV